MRAFMWWRPIVSSSWTLNCMLPSPVTRTTRAPRTRDASADQRRQIPAHGAVVGVGIDALPWLTAKEWKTECASRELPVSTTSSPRLRKGRGRGSSCSHGAAIARCNRPSPAGSAASTRGMLKHPARRGPSCRLPSVAIAARNGASIATATSRERCGLGQFALVDVHHDLGRVWRKAASVEPDRRDGNARSRQQRSRSEFCTSEVRAPLPRGPEAAEVEGVVLAQHVHAPDRRRRRDPQTRARSHRTAPGSGEAYAFSGDDDGPTAPPQRLQDAAHSMRRSGSRGGTDAPARCPVPGRRGDEVAGLDVERDAQPCGPGASGRRGLPWRLEGIGDARWVVDLYRELRHWPSPCGRVDLLRTDLAPSREVRRKVRRT